MQTKNLSLDISNFTLNAVFDDKVLRDFVSNTEKSGNLYQNYGIDFVFNHKDNEADLMANRISGYNTFVYKKENKKLFFQCQAFDIFNPESSVESLETKIFIEYKLLNNEYIAKLFINVFMIDNSFMLNNINTTVPYCNTSYRSLYDNNSKRSYKAQSNYGFLILNTLKKVVFLKSTETTKGSNIIGIWSDASNIQSPFAWSICHSHWSKLENKASNFLFAHILRPTIPPEIYMVSKTSLQKPCHWFATSNVRMAKIGSKIKPRNFTIKLELISTDDPMFLHMLPASELTDVNFGISIASSQYNSVDPKTLNASNKSVFDIRDSFEHYLLTHNITTPNICKSSNLKVIKGTENQIMDINETYYYTDKAEKVNPNSHELSPNLTNKIVSESFISNVIGQAKQVLQENMVVLPTIPEKNIATQSNLTPSPDSEIEIETQPMTECKHNQETKIEQITENSSKLMNDPTFNDNINFVLFTTLKYQQQEIDTLKRQLQQININASVHNSELKNKTIPDSSKVALKNGRNSVETQNNMCNEIGINTGMSLILPQLIHSSSTSSSISKAQNAQKDDKNILRNNKSQQTTLLSLNNGKTNYPRINYVHNNDFNLMNHPKSIANECLNNGHPFSVPERKVKFVKGKCTSSPLETEPRIISANSFSTPARSILRSTESQEGYFCLSTQTINSTTTSILFKSPHSYQRKKKVREIEQIDKVAEKYLRRMNESNVTLMSNGHKPNKGDNPLSALEYSVHSKKYLKKYGLL